MELRIWNVELVGFADYIIMNYSINLRKIESKDSDESYDVLDIYSFINASI